MSDPSVTYGTTMDLENQPKKLPYPKSVFFIICNEFCERFSYYGMKAVLSLYLISTLRYSENNATVLYHLFTMSCYMFPLFGAIIADSFWGKFNTIFYLSLIYAAGNVVLSFASIGSSTLPYRELSLLGLFMISIGTGGIKPCVSSFGGDQFVLPEQALQLQRFFSVFYFSINAGSLLSTSVTPILRNNVKCFDQDTCFPLAFGTPAVLMIVSVVIFVSGRSLYIIKRPKENVVTIFMKCIASALKNKFFGSDNTGKKDHWLEYADDKYSKKQIDDIVAVLRVLFLLIPVPLYWALSDQQGSRWIFQANNMDGRFFGVYIKPDQMHVINPSLVLLFIPMFELFVYPVLARLGIKTPLQKLTIGGFTAAASFVISAYVEHFVEQSYAIVPLAGEGQIRVFNSLNCTLRLDPAIESINTIEPLSVAHFFHLPANQVEKLNKSVISADAPCNLNPAEIQLQVYPKKSKSYFIYEKSGAQLALYEPAIFDMLKKDQRGAAKIRPFYDSVDSYPITLTFSEGTSQFSNSLRAITYYGYISVDPGTYDVLVNGTKILENVIVGPGEIDVLLLKHIENKVIGNVINVVPPNKVHMLWQLPQIFVITAAEIMFYITGLEFCFTQAPQSMKSVLSSAWLLNIAFGNLIIVIIAKINMFESQVHQFLLYAGLMVLDMLVFIAISMKYQYVDYSNEHDEEKDNDEKGSVPTLASDLST